MGDKMTIQQYEKEIKKAEKSLDRVQRNLASEGFVMNAPTDLVDREKFRERDLVRRINQLRLLRDELSTKVEGQTHE